MDIKVNYIKTPIERIKVIRKTVGAKGGKIGGKANVAKGFAKMDKEKLKKVSKEAANKRWGK